ncbi:hypothetical protein QJQ45_025229, partial [Haematococcus lacustris]
MMPAPSPPILAPRPPAPLLSSPPPQPSNAMGTPLFITFYGLDLWSLLTSWGSRIQALLEAQQSPSLSLQGLSAPGMCASQLLALNTTALLNTSLTAQQLMPGLGYFANDVAQLLRDYLQDSSITVQVTDFCAGNRTAASFTANRTIVNGPWPTLRVTINLLTTDPDRWGVVLTELGPYPGRQTGLTPTSWPLAPGLGGYEHMTHGTHPRSITLQLTHLPSVAAMASAMSCARVPCFESRSCPSACRLSSPLGPLRQLPVNCSRLVLRHLMRPVALQCLRPVATAPVETVLLASGNAVWDSYMVLFQTDDTFSLAFCGGLSLAAVGVNNNSEDDSVFPVCQFGPGLSTFTRTLTSGTKYWLMSSSCGPASPQSVSDVNSVVGLHSGNSGDSIQSWYLRLQYGCYGWKC